MRVRSLFQLIVLPFLAAGCSKNDDGAAPADSGAGVAAAAAPADSGEARQAIEAAKDRYIAAVERGDTVGIALSFTDDATVLFPAGPPAKGKAAVTRAFAELLSRSRVNNLEGRRSDLIVSGDMAAETGTYEIKTQPTAGRETVDRGQYLIVWRRQLEGTWKMARAFNRSDAPLR